MARDKPTYDGILAEPLPADAGPKELIERLQALYRHYGLPDDDLGGSDAQMSLILALAADHVPGFQPENLGGRPREMVKDLIVWTRLVEAEMSGKSVNNAARMLAARRPDLGKQTTIRKRYLELKTSVQRGDRRGLEFVDFVEYLHQKAEGKP